MLKGNQNNLDLNKNGKLDSEDFKMLRGEKMKRGGSSDSIPKTWEQAIDMGKENLYLQNRLDQDMKGFPKPYIAKVNKQYSDSFIYINAKDKPELIAFLKKKGFKFTDYRNKIGQGDQLFNKIGAPLTYVYKLKTKKVMEEGGQMKQGGTLKPIPEENKGLPNLPEKVRNNMGYMKKGGKTKAPKRSAHSIELDSEIKAKKPGRRVSASGNVYYESRPNHADENRKKKPYLEMGGKMEMGGEATESKWVYKIGGLNL